MNTPTKLGFRSWLGEANPCGSSSQRSRQSNPHIDINENNNNNKNNNNNSNINNT